MGDDTCFISQHRCNVNRARTPFQMNENTEELLQLPLSVSSEQGRSCAAITGRTLEQ